MSARPSPSHKLAILLPVDSKDPQLTWIKCDRHIHDKIDEKDQDEEEYAWEMPDANHLLSVENLNTEKYRTVMEFKKITRNMRREFNLDHMVQVICRETFGIDGSSTNVCVESTTKGRMVHDWRGPLLVMRLPGTTVDSELYEDVRAGDFRVAINYFLAYGPRN